MKTLPLSASGIVLMGLIAALAAIPGPARADGVKDVVTYRGSDRLARLEAGAKKEGVVLMYTTGTQIEPILNRFRAKYPGIRLEVYRAGSTDVTRRVVEEYKAGHHVVDTIFLNLGGLKIMRDAGALIPFETPEAAFYEADAKEPNGHWINAWESYVGLAYNTKAVSTAEAPKTYEDLLDPKWKNKMAISNRSSTLNNWVGAIVLSKGEDYLRKLGKQGITVYKMSGRALSNLVVLGEVPISPAVYQAHMINSARKGATVKWQALGPVYAGAGGGAIAAKSPHPHAAMLLADFFLSKEGQSMRQDIGDASARTDLVTPGKPTKAYYLTNRPNYEREFETWGLLARELFGKAKDRKKKK